MHAHSHAGNQRERRDNFHDGLREARAASAQASAGYRGSRVVFGFRLLSLQAERHGSLTHPRVVIRSVEKRLIGRVELGSFAGSHGAKT
jgi:hypothetical protein